jgi:hypothetical protein
MAGGQPRCAAAHSPNRPVEKAVATKESNQGENQPRYRLSGAKFIGEDVAVPLNAGAT